jgi:surface polysaccharide O-acyltransferase-like enzyme
VSVAETAIAEESRGRIVAFDLLRLLAAVSVVGIHSLMMYRGILPPTAPISIVDDLLHYAVPVFVFISGALVWGAPPRDTQKEFWRRRFSTIIAPYLAWTVVYLALDFAQAAKPSEVLASIPALVLTGETWYHLYFVPMLLFFYLFTPLARKAVRRSPELLVLGIFAVRILFIGPLISGAEALGGATVAAFATHVVVHAPEMALGAWFAVRRDRAIRPLALWWPALLGVGLLAQLAELLELVPASLAPARSALLALSMALVVLGWVGASLALAQRLGFATAGRVHSLGDLTYGVYLAHPVFVLAFDLALQALGVEPVAAWWFALATWALVLAASVALVAALARTPLRVMSGMRRAPRTPLRLRRSA